jgi:hypothetical protein
LSILGGVGKENAMATRKTPSKATGPFADTKVRSKWQHVPGETVKHWERRKKAMSKLPFPDRVKK